MNNLTLTQERWDYLKLQPYYSGDIKKLLDFRPRMTEHEVVKFWNWYSQSKCMVWAEIPDSWDEIKDILTKYGDCLSDEIKKKYEN